MFENWGLFINLVLNNSLVVVNLYIKTQLFTIRKVKEGGHGQGVSHRSGSQF